MPAVHARRTPCRDAEKGHQADLRSLSAARAKKIHINSDEIDAFEGCQKLINIKILKKCSSFTNRRAEKASPAPEGKRRLLGLEYRLVGNKFFDM